MRPFLKQIASLFFERCGNTISDYCFVVPNRRAGLFFQYYLAEIADRPLFSPTIITINELFERLSPLRLADRTTLLFILYKKYRELNEAAESFDDFIFWGEMILGDFDDIDKYQVNPEKVYTLINDMKEVDEQFGYLTKEQVAIIQRFWSRFNPVGDYEHKIAFARMWRLLYPLYESFRTELRDRGIGYEGMMMRDVAENPTDVLPLLPARQIVFVGLNALSRTEEALMKSLRNEGIADFYWDYVSPKVNDPDNRASHFVRSNCQNFPSAYPLEEELLPETEFHLIGIPSSVGQTKQLASLLETLHADDGGAPLATAVVLPDESLLHPLLYAIPSCYDVVNVTMGYPLKDTPIAALIDLLMELQRSVRLVRGETMFYHRFTLAVLNHRYVKSLAPEAIGRLVENIVKNNRVYIPAVFFESISSLYIIFTPLSGEMSITAYLKNVIQLIQVAMSKNETTDEEEEPVSTIAIERECLYHYFLLLNRMEDLVDEIAPRMQLDTWLKMIRRMSASATIPYRGEPLSGLQIMGVLETRALDFENLVVLSMNDGLFPSKRPANTFIPFNIRDGFGLPTYRLQDSVFAYHFYRLIHRAKRVWFFYDTRSEGLNSGEVSRYVHQLRYHYRVEKFTETQLSYDVNQGENHLVVRKTDDVVEKLRRFLAGGDRYLSASAINTYLDCPLKFYYSVVEGIKESDEVSEEIESDMFGTLFHRAIETLLSDFENQQITPDLLKRMTKDENRLTKVIEYAFAKDFFKNDQPVPLKGRNFMIGEIIRNYLKKVLDVDCRIGTFTYLKGERKLFASLPLGNERDESVQLIAFIDRLDRVGNTTRVIDYKSGRADLNAQTLFQLFDPEIKDRRKAAMQVMLYSLIVWLADGDDQTQPCIYSLRNLYADPFKSNISCKELGGAIEDFSIVRQLFTEQLTVVINRIFDPLLPFTQTSVTEHCAVCEFVALCRK